MPGKKLFDKRDIGEDSRDTRAPQESLFSVNLYSSPTMDWLSSAALFGFSRTFDTAGEFPTASNQPEGGEDGPPSGSIIRSLRRPERIRQQYQKCGRTLRAVQIKHDFIPGSLHGFIIIFILVES
jgi:hypothetical protein